MLRCLAVLSLLPCVVAIGQTTAPPSGSDWSRVQAVAPGTTVRIKLLKDTGSAPAILVPTVRVNCEFIRATDAEVFCTRTDRFLFFPVHRRFNFARSAVASVRLTRPNLSGFVGGAIGVGAGLGIAGGAIASKGETDHSEDGLVYGLFAVALGSLGSAIGTGTDFMGGPTIYRAP